MYPTIHKTINGGATWTQTSLIGQSCLAHISFPTNVKGFSMGGEGLFAKTSDTGSTWAQNNIANTYGINSMFFIDSLTGYAVGRDYAAGQYAFIIKTTDGGAYWTTDLTFTVQAIQDIFFPTDTVGYAVGGSGAGVILKIDNGTFISEIESDFSCFKLISIYATPLTKKLNIKFQATSSKNISLKIFNSIGQLKLSSYFDITNNQQNSEIDISALPKGLYFINLRSECNQTTRKIVMIE